MNLKEASKALVKNVVGGVIKAFPGNSMRPTADLITTSTYRGSGGFWFWGNDGTEVHFTYGGLNDGVRAYSQCSVIAAIINRQAQAYVNGKTWLTLQGGKGKGKEATSEDAKKIRRLLVLRPNVLQNGKQFEAQGYIYRRLFGFNVILAIKPVGFPNKDAKSLWNVPPFMLDIQLKRTAFFLATSIKDCIQSIHFDFSGIRVPLNLDDILIVTDFTASIDNVVLPDSRIKSLAMPINNIIGAYESRNVLINRRGPIAFVSSDKSDESGNIALTPAEKTEINKDFGSTYGLRARQMQWAITSSAIKIQTVGFATRDLMLMEEVTESAKAICDGLNYPPHLLGLIDPTFNNQEAAERGLYQNSIMPDAESIYEQYSEWLGVEGLNLCLTKDYSHLQVLQEDDLKKAQARAARNTALLIEFQNNLLTLNRWLEINGEDPIPGTDGNLYYYQLKEKGWAFGAGTPASSQNNNQNQPSNGTGN